MTRRKGRCLQCLALTAAVISLLLCGSAMADGGPAGQISAEAWLSLIAMIIFALIAGYMGRLNGEIRDHKSLTAKQFEAVSMEQRQQQTQLNLMRENFHKEHPSTREFVDLREDMKDRFDRLESLIRSH
jgi:hypothetical protein